MTTENTLAQWLEDEQKILAGRPNGRPIGLLDKSKTTTMTGMEVMQAVMRGDLPNGPMAATCGYLIVALEPGQATLQGNPTESVMNVPAFWTAQSGTPSTRCCRLARATPR